MNSFFEEFTNREIAIFLWLGIFIFIMLFLKNVRQSAGGIFKHFFSPKFQMIFIPLCIYSFCIIYILKLLRFWDFNLLKDSIFWFFGVAFSQIFRITKKVDIPFFKKIIIDAVKITILLEFVLNTYVFSLPIELAFVLVLIILSALKPIAESKIEYKDVNSCITNLLAIAGIGMTAFALYQTVVHYKDFFSTHNLKSILLSPILTILYIPFLYLLAVFFTYERFYPTLRYKTAGDKKLLRYLKWEIFKIAGLNITKLNNIISNISKKHVLTIENKREYLKLVSRSQ